MLLYKHEIPILAKTKWKIWVFLTYGENDNKAMFPQFFPIEQWSNELFLEKSIESGKHITHKAQLELYKAHYHINVSEKFCSKEMCWISFIIISHAYFNHWFLLLRNSYSVSLGKSALKFNLQYPSLILSGDLANQDTLKANQDNSVKQ